MSEEFLRERERVFLGEKRRGSGGEATTTAAAAAFSLKNLYLTRLFFLPLESPAKYSEASPPDFEALAEDLPEDHPFAVRSEVSPEEAELAAARLRIRRGLPLRDLSGARGFSSDEERRDR